MASVGFQFLATAMLFLEVEFIEFAKRIYPLISPDNLNDVESFYPSRAASTMR